MYNRNRDGSKSTNLGMGVGWSWDGCAQGICKEINFVCLVKELAVYIEPITDTVLLPHKNTNTVS